MAVSKLFCKNMTIVLTCLHMELYIYIALYALIVIGSAVIIGRKANTESFLIAGRDRGFLQIMSSKFAISVSVVWFMTYTGYAYQFGTSVLSIIPGLAISYLLFAYWVVPRIYKESRDNKFYTQGDFVFSHIKNVYAKRAIDIAGALINFVWLLVMVIGGAKVFEYLN